MVLVYHNVSLMQFQYIFVQPEGLSLPQIHNSSILFFHVFSVLFFYFYLPLFILEYSLCYFSVRSVCFLTIKTIADSSLISRLALRTYLQLKETLAGQLLDLPFHLLNCSSLPLLLGCDSCHVHGASCFSLEQHEPSVQGVRELCLTQSAENQLSSAFPGNQSCLGLVLCASEQRQGGAWEEECPHVCTLRCAARKALLCSSLSVSSPQRGCSLCNLCRGAGRGWTVLGEEVSLLAQLLL